MTTVFVRASSLNLAAAALADACHHEVVRRASMQCLLLHAVLTEHEGENFPLQGLGS